MKLCEDDLSVHRFCTLLEDLLRVALNVVPVKDKPDCLFPIVTEQSEVQDKAFDLLKIKLAKYVPINVPTWLRLTS